MITKETDYAIRVVLHLSSQPEGLSVATAELAVAMGIPYRFLRKIVRRMVSAGLLLSHRGKGGGIRLAKPTREITLLSVINAIDRRSLQLNACVGGRNTCARQGVCAVHPKLREIQHILDGKLESVTFEALANGDAN